MNRLTRILVVSALATTTALSVSANTGAKTAPRSVAALASQYVSANDGTPLFFKDWGPRNGPVVVFSHGWPLSADSWEGQMLFLAERGYRVVAHDRRGHGRSGQAWGGHDMNQYADDLAAVMNALNLQNATLVGFSTGGGEVTRYVGRHGSKRVAKVVLVGAVTPMMVKAAENPNGVPMEVFDGLRKGSIDNRAQLYKDIAAGPFFGFNRPGALASVGLVDSFWGQGMAASHKATYDSIKAFSETSFFEDLKKFDIPTLVIHGTDDQIVPIQSTGRVTAKLVRNARLIEYAGAPHGLTDTHKDRLNADLLDFIKR